MQHCLGCTRTAGKELLFARAFFPRNVFRGRRRRGCFQPCSARPTAPPPHKQPSDPLTRHRQAPSPLPLPLPGCSAAAGAGLPDNEATPTLRRREPPPGRRAAPSGSGCGTHLFGRSSPIKFSATFSSC